MNFVIAIILVPVIWFPLAMLYAWALQVLWNWYVPAIFDLPMIPYSAALGIGLIVGFLAKGIPRTDSDRPWSDKWWDFVAMIIRPLAAVGSGWVYLQIWPLPLTP